MATSVESLAALYSYVPAVTTPLHSLWLPVGLLDLYGAIRLSMAVNWIAGDTKGKPRASALQEVIGILIIVFGGDTFLSLCAGTTPGWLIDPTFAMIFAGTHLVLSRTPIHQLLPAKPVFLMELILSIPDAINRALLLTRFTVVPLLHPVEGAKVLPATPSTLLLVPFIITVPAAVFVFTATDFFSSSITLQTPAELLPWGWTALDAWLPLVLPALFLSLIGPVPGWPWGLGTEYSEATAIVICAFVAIVTFVSRCVYNLGPKSTSKAGKKIKARKIKKA